MSLFLRGLLSLIALPIIISTSEKPIAHSAPASYFVYKLVRDERELQRLSHISDEDNTVVDMAEEKVHWSAVCQQYNLELLNPRMGSSLYRVSPCGLYLGERSLKKDHLYSWVIKHLQRGLTPHEAKEELKSYISNYYATEAMRYYKYPAKKRLVYDTLSNLTAQYPNAMVSELMDQIKHASLSTTHPLIGENLWREEDTNKSGE